MDIFTKLKQFGRQRSRSVIRDDIWRQFEAAWLRLHWLFFTDNRGLPATVSDSEIPRLLGTLVDCLVREQAMGGGGAMVLPVGDYFADVGSCLEYVLKREVLQTVCDMSLADYPLGMMRETLTTMSNLVALMDSQFLVPFAVHRPLLKFISACANDRHQAEVYAEPLVELMFALAAKIQSHPAILPIFFMDHSNSDSNWSNHSSLESPESREQLPLARQFNLNRHQNNYDFALFQLLVRFVHCANTVGDYARTAITLLLQIDSEPLQDYILRVAEFPVVLVAGLSALFLQLPHQLERVTSPTVDVPVGMLDQQRPAHRSDSSAEQIGRVFTSQHQFQQQQQQSAPVDELGCFVKLVAYCDQTARQHPRLRPLLVEKFKSVFLASVLRQSIVGAGESDGAAGAVTFYVLCMAQNIADVSMHDALVDFLLSSPSSLSSVSVRACLLANVGSERQSVKRATIQLLTLLLNRAPDPRRVLTLLHPAVAQLDLQFIRHFDPWRLLQQQSALVHQRYLALLVDIDSLRDYDSYIDDAIEQCQVTDNMVVHICDDNDATDADATFAYEYTEEVGIDERLVQWNDSQDLEIPRLYLMAMIEPLLTGDSLLLAVMNDLAHFHQLPFETNLAVTGYLSALQSAGCPLLNSILCHADLFVPGTQSLYTILSQVRPQMCALTTMSRRSSSKSRLLTISTSLDALNIDLFDAVVKEIVATGQVVRTLHRQLHVDYLNSQ